MIQLISIWAWGLGFRFPGSRQNIRQSSMPLWFQCLELSWWPASLGELASSRYSERSYLQKHKMEADGWRQPSWVPCAPRNMYMHLLKHILSYTHKLKKRRKFKKLQVRNIFWILFGKYWLKLYYTLWNVS